MDWIENWAMKRRAKRLGRYELNVEPSVLLTNGEQLYGYIDAGQMHVDRYVKLHDLINLLSYQITPLELEDFITSYEKAANYKDAQGNSRPKDTVIAALIMELRTRKDNIINKDCILEMVACLHLTETEVKEGGKWLPNEHKRKLSLFETNAPSSDFFLRVNMSVHIPFLKTLEKQGKDTINVFLEKLENDKKHLEAFWRVVNSALEPK